MFLFRILCPNSFGRNISLTGILVTSLFIFSKCENSIEVINTITTIKQHPTISGYSSEILYSDSARIKIKVIAPELRSYSTADPPYIEFPLGMTVIFFDEELEVESEITSKYAIYHESKRLWEAREDVVAVNLKENEQLNTEELFWDEEKELIYSEKFSRITNNNGIFYGERGFEADQNFTRWKLKGSKGTVNVKEDE